MRLMLEEECEAIRDSQGGGAPGAVARGAACSGDAGASGKKRARVPHTGGDSSILASLLKHRAGGLQVRRGACMAGWRPGGRAAVAGRLSSRVGVARRLAMQPAPSSQPGQPDDRRAAPSPPPRAVQEDTAATAEDADRYGRDRLSNVADTWQGRELDPSRILGAQRHGKWFKQAPAQGAGAAGRGGGAWCVWVRGCLGCVPARFAGVVAACPAAFCARHAACWRPMACC